MTRITHRASGFAVAVVIVLIGVLAVVLTAVAGKAVVDQRRAAEAGEAIQVSRLLAASAQIAWQQIAESNTHNGPVATPLGQVSLVWRGTADVRVCDLEVAFGHTRRVATLTFSGSSVSRMD